MPQAVTVLVLIVTTVALIKVRPVLAFSLVWFFAILAPSSSVVPIASEVAAERRMYLPLASLVVLAVVAVDVALRRLSSAPGPSDARARVRTSIVAILMVGTVGLFSLMSFRRNLDYRSEEVIWRTSVARWPQARAQNNLGAVLIENNQPTEAIHFLKQAVQSAPNYSRARLNLAQALQATADRPGSIVEYEEYLRLQPQDADVHERVGGLYLEMGKPAEAGRHLRDTLRLNPAADSARLELARALLGLDQAVEAEQLFPGVPREPCRRCSCSSWPWPCAVASEPRNRSRPRAHPGSGHRTVDGAAPSRPRHRPAPQQPHGRSEGALRDGRTARSEAALRVRAAEQDEMTVHTPRAH